MRSLPLLFSSGSLQSSFRYSAQNKVAKITKEYRSTKLNDKKDRTSTVIELNPDVYTGYKSRTVAEIEELKRIGRSADDMAAGGPSA